MDFQYIKPVEDADSYLDLAFRRAKRSASQLRGKASKKKFLQKKKEEGIIRIDTVQDNIKISIERIVQSFPSLNNLDAFYKELMKMLLPYVEVKKSLARLDGAKRKIMELSGDYKRKIQNEEDAQKVAAHWKSYYGRISSIFRQIKKVFPFLDKARQTMQAFPVIKDFPTVALFGFPNVGKTTLLSKLTESKPEIQEYSFTTKGINVAYLKDIQLLDTPGTLNRFEKMNIFEKQAWLALEYLAEAIIYVYDPAESYLMADQKKLFKKIEKMDIPIYIYVSKADMFPEEAKNIAEEVGGTTDYQKIAKKLHALFPKKKEKPSKD